MLASLSRIGAERVKSEWEWIKKALLPELEARLHLVAIVDGVQVGGANKVSTPLIERFLKISKKGTAPDDVRSSGGIQQPQTGTLPGISWKHLDVEKVLVYRWLLGSGPIAVGLLCRQVGCSYPTAIQAIRQLSAKELIERGRGRDVALRRYPRDRWSELFRMQRLVYPPEEYFDPTAEPGTVEAILQRLQRLRPKGVAIGGVVAARHWDPSFDLNGTPRIDLVLHRVTARANDPGGGIRHSAELVRQIDPALRPRSANARGASVLVIHPMYRHDSLFLEAPRPLAALLADPVEVLIHLNEMGLTAQAGQLLRRLRPELKS